MFELAVVRMDAGIEAIAYSPWGLAAV